MVLLTSNHARTCGHLCHTLTHVKDVDMAERTFAAMAPRPVPDEAGFAGAKASSAERIMAAAATRLPARVSSLRAAAFHMRPYISAEHTKFIKQLNVVVSMSRHVHAQELLRRVDGVVAAMSAAIVEPFEAGQGGAAPRHDEDGGSLSPCANEGWASASRCGTPRPGPGSSNARSTSR